jgi:adenylate cyclase
MDLSFVPSTMDAKDIVFICARFFEIATFLVDLFDGVTTEILGDGVLCFWGATHEASEQADRACDVAVAMQQALITLNQEMETLNLPAINIGIGISSGNVLCGLLGSSYRIKFGCIGPAVNLASRLESLCSRAPEE